MTEREQIEHDIAYAEAQLQAARLEQRDQGYYSYSGTHEERLAFRVRVTKLAKAVRSWQGKVKRLENKLADLDGPPVHHDIFDQEFKVGCRVAWSSSGRYAGAQLGTVTGISRKQVRVSQLQKWRPESGTSIYPKNLIIVDKLVEGYNPQEE